MKKSSMKKYDDDLDVLLDEFDGCSSEEIEKEIDVVEDEETNQYLSDERYYAQMEEKDEEEEEEENWEFSIGKKNITDEEEEVEEEPQPVIKKKRGRPRKEKVEETPVEEVEELVDEVVIEEESVEEESVVEPPTKKKRGRPAIVKNVIPDEKRFDIPLRNVDNEFIHTEFGENVYHFKAIEDPDNNKREYFTCFYKNTSKPDSKWVASRNLLSKSNYRVTHMEKFIDIMKNDMKFGNTYVRKFWNPFLMTWVGETKQKVEVFENKFEREIFRMITCINEEELNFRSKIHVYMLNSYNGTASMNVRFVTNIEAKDESGKKYSFNDYFTLGTLSHRILHSGNISSIVESIDNVQKILNETVQPLKEFDDEKTLSILSKQVANVFSFKETREQLLDVFNNLPKAYKNLYFLILLASKHLDKNYRTETYMNLGKIINSYIYRVTKEHNKKKEKK